MVTQAQAAAHQGQLDPATPAPAELSSKVSALAEELSSLGFRHSVSSGASPGASAAADARPAEASGPLDSDDDEARPFGPADPLYDEHADSDDEEWVRAAMLGGCKPDDLTESVSCPSCFAPLSMQVQQHVRYEGQFRAVFVTNCKVVEKERLRITTDRLGRRPNKGEVYKPVVCRRCDTEVAVLDEDGVYHFCNVIY